MEGTKLKEWVCPICKSIGKLRLDRFTEEENQKAGNRKFRIEVHYGEAEPNSYCSKCKHRFYIIETKSY